MNHDHVARFLGELREPGAPYFSPYAEKLHDFLRGAASVLAIAVELTGGDHRRAVFWFRNVPLMDLDGRTAEQLVADGLAEGVREYLLNLSAGATG